MVGPLEELWMRAKDKISRTIFPKSYASEGSLDYSNADANATTMNQGQPATRLPGQIIPVYNPPLGPTRQDMVTNPPPTNTTTNSGDTLGDTTGGTSGWDTLLAAANSRLGALKSGASDAYNTASDYVSKGMSKLGEKRGQFQDLFKQGEGDIAVGYSKNAGEAGRTAEAQRTAAANSARATGTGGSFLASLGNRVNDALARTLASVGQTRSVNERENRGLLNDRMDWATGQEQSLDNYLRQASDAKRQADSLNAADYAENIGGLESMFADIMSRFGGAPSTSGYGSYGNEKSGVDWASIVNALNGVTNPSSTYATASTAEQANPVSLNPVLADLLKRRQGTVQ